MKDSVKCFQVLCEDLSSCCEDTLVPYPPSMDRGGGYSYPGRSRSPVSNKKVTWREPVDQTQHGQQAAVSIPCLIFNAVYFFMLIYIFIIQFLKAMFGQECCK